MLKNGVIHMPLKIQRSLSYDPDMSWNLKKSNLLLIRKCLQEWVVPTLVLV